MVTSNQKNVIRESNNILANEEQSKLYASYRIGRICVEAKQVGIPITTLMQENAKAGFHKSESYYYQSYKIAQTFNSVDINKAVNKQVPIKIVHDIAKSDVSEHDQKVMLREAVRVAGSRIRTSRGFRTKRYNDIFSKRNLDVPYPESMPSMASRGNDDPAFITVFSRKSYNAFTRALGRPVTQENHLNGLLKAMSKVDPDCNIIGDAKTEEEVADKYYQFFQQAQKNA